MKRRVTLPSIPESVSAAARFVEAVAREATLPQPMAERILLAASEAVANAIEHGNASEAGREVRLEWTPHDDGGVLSVEDEGGGLPLRRVLEAELPADPYRTSGRGLYLIRTLAEGVETEGACLRLWFALRPGESA